jgi:DNA-binding beta-propeller fold protein YncE
VRALVSQTYGVLAPGGRSGNLDLVEGATHAVTAIGGFSMEPLYFAGHDQGATSVEEGAGFLFVTDRTTREVHVVDPIKKQIVDTATVATSPDYVRYLPQTNEVWVTEPDAERIEVFTLVGSQLTHAAVISILGGPESLVIDKTRDRGCTHLWSGGSVSVDVRARTVVRVWPNGCNGSRGIALDETRGFLFAGCDEGRAAVQSNAVIAIASVDAAGHLSLLGTKPTIAGAHCVAADDRGNAWVCDPDDGQLLVVVDDAKRSAS